MSINPIIIGLYSSTPHQGKGEVAKALDRAGFEKISFADCMRDMLDVLLRRSGLSERQAYVYLYEDKESIIPELNVSARYLMRTLGTQWGRQMINRNIWLTTMEGSIKGHSRVVIDDVRFPDEYGLITRLGGVLWKVERKHADFVAPPLDASSDGLLNHCIFDDLILNDGEIDNLHRQVLRKWAQLWKAMGNRDAAY